MSIEDIRKILVDNDLKITPQRLAVLEQVTKQRKHPSAEKIIQMVRRRNPNISVGTVYKILDTFVDHGLISKVKTDRDIMRYEAVKEKHHHLYCSDSDRIEDFYDEELTRMIEQYLEKKNIPDFEIEEINLQIIGKFLNRKNYCPRDK